MGLVIFGTYFWSRVRRCSMTHQDAATALALYFVYPAILFLLIDKFHGLCGPQAYLEKAEAIAVNEAFYMPFTVLMRTHKILSIILYQAQTKQTYGGSNSSGKDKDDDDEDDHKKRQSFSPHSRSTKKTTTTTTVAAGTPTRNRGGYRSSGGGSSDDETGGGGNSGRGRGNNSRNRSRSRSDDERNYSDNDDGSESDGSYDDDDGDDDSYDDEDDDTDYDDDDDDEGCTRQKCRVWFHLSQELTAVCCVAFLLLVCLPVLAFWFMFLGIIASSVSLLLLLKRVWREAHVSTFAMSSDNKQQQTTTPEEDEEEFQEFLKNFT